MTTDRLDWIFEAKDTPALQSKYDAWAATYDADHDEWGWNGPQDVAEMALRLGSFSETSTIHDAGCGTGKVGVALRRAGFAGKIVGSDISQGMLEVAAQTSAYDSLVKCSLLDLPVAANSTDAIVSSGVFTHGHVGGEAFTELCRITRAGGLVVLTQRVDLLSDHEPHSNELEHAGGWKLTERTSPRNLHTDRNPVEQVITTWQVT